MQKSAESQSLEKYLSQTIELKCSCKHIETVMVLNAWVTNVVCSKCGEDLLDEDTRNALLSDKMRQKSALALTALMMVHNAHFRGSTRQVVTDMFCVLEISLKEQINEYLKSKKVDEDLIEYLLESNWQTDRTIKLLKALKFERPEKIEQKIRKIKVLRNKVVHQGYVPAYKEANEMVTEILKIVGEIKPPKPSILDRLIARNEYSEALSRAIAGGPAAGFVPRAVPSGER